MRTKIEKTVIIELTEAEAFVIKTYLELAQKELKGAPNAYYHCAKKLIDKFEEIDV